MEILMFEEYLSRNYNHDLVVAIGQFDGIHIAHKELLKITLNSAKTNNYKSAVITFDPHPDYVLGKDETNKRVMSIEEKAKVLGEIGIDYLIIIRFSKEVSRITPKQFIIDYLFTIKVKEVVVGSDFVFGRNGSGSGEMILELSGMKIKGTVVPEMRVDDEKIGTCKLKCLLKEGKVKEIKRWLGRNFSVIGIVEQGRQIGRTIGFPTINLSLRDDFVDIKKGVYAVYVYYNYKKYQGIANIGNNPSFNFKNNLSLETYIFDFEKDIYNEIVTIEFIDFIREEKKYNSKEELISQINEDIVLVKKILNNDI